MCMRRSKKRISNAVPRQQLKKREKGKKGKKGKQMKTNFYELKKEPRKNENLLLTRCTSNRIVNTQQRHGRLKRALETLHFAHRRLEHARGDVVPDLAIEQVQAVPHVLLLPIVLGR